MNSATRPNASSARPARNWTARCAGRPDRAERYLGAYPLLAAQVQSVVELIYAEFITREELGQRPTPEEYYLRFPRWKEASAASSTSTSGSASTWTTTPRRSPSRRKGRPASCRTASGPMS